MKRWQLFKTLIRNASAYAMDCGAVGYSVEQRLGPVQPESALAFAQATKDFNPAYRQQDGPAPPFLLYKLMFPLIEQVLCHPKLNLNLLRGVFADQRIHWHEPIKLGDRLTVQITIADILDTPVGQKLKAAGSVMRNDHLVCSTETGFIVRRKTRTAPEAKPPAQHGEELFHAAIQTDPGQQLRFAAASGDGNFIHTSRMLARLAGLKGPIMHGACIMAMSCAALTEKLLGNDTTRIEAMGGRFGKPVFPGDLLFMSVYQTTASDSAVFAVRNAAGQTVFKDGIFTFKGNACT